MAFGVGPTGLRDIFVAAILVVETRKNAFLENAKDGGLV